MKKMLLITLFFHALWGEAWNPFEIDYPKKRELTHDDYEYIQNQIREKNLEELVESIYPIGFKYSKNDLLRRISSFTKQTMIVKEKNLFPQAVHLPGDFFDGRCVVLGCSYDKNYPKLLLELVQGLREIGYKGGIYYRLGGFPNPTGEEIRFAAVPYAMKMFMLYEAYQLGYPHVLWLDCSAWPLKPLDYCFERIEKEGLIVESGRANTQVLIPQTRAILEKTFGMDFSKAPHVAGWLIGFDMHAPFVKRIFEDYYKMVRQGTPFISITPEESVLTALFAKHAPCLTSHQNLMIAGKYHDARLMEGREKGVRFLIRSH